MNKHQVYSEQIKPLLDQITAIAQQHKISVLTVVQTNEDEDDSYTIEVQQNLSKLTASSDLSPSLGLASVAAGLSPAAATKLLPTAAMLREN